MKVLSLLALLLLAVACTGFQYTEEWEEWKAKYNKVYEDKQLEDRNSAIFESNMRFIEEHNANADYHGFTLAMNAYGCMVSNTVQ